MFVTTKVVALPKATSKEHIVDNTKLDFDIAEEDMNILNIIKDNNYGKFSYFPVFSGKKRQG